MVTMTIFKFAAVATLSLSLTAAGAAQAGGMAEPVLEPEVIAEETSDTSGFVVPLILLAIIAAILLIDGGDGGGGSVSVSPGLS